MIEPKQIKQTIENEEQLQIRQLNLNLTSYFKCLIEELVIFLHILHLFAYTIIIYYFKRLKKQNQSVMQLLKTSAIFLFLEIHFFFFKTLYFEGFVINMDLDYDNVRLKKNSYDKKLAILKEKIKNYRVFKRKKLTRTRSEVPLSSLDNIPQSEHPFGNSEDNEKTSEEAITFKRQNFVKLFIEKLRQNSFNSINNNKIHLDRIKQFTEKVDTVSMQNEPKGPRGWKPPNFVRLSVTLLTLFAILCIQLLSTFQCLFEDYRQLYSNQKSLVILKYVLLLITILRILSKMIFVSTILGQKIEHLASLCFRYVTHLEFYMDICMLISILLIILHPQSGWAGVFGCCVLILNVIYFQKTNKQIDIFVITNNIKKQILALFKLLLANLFMSHLVSIIVIAIGTYSSGTSWMDKYGIRNQSWWPKYIYGLYYSTTIITTVGFGDISVFNIQEAIVVTFVMLFGCIILSYNITKVANIIESLNAIPERVRNQLSVLDRLAAVAQINEYLHHTISEYIIHAAEIKRTFEISERHELIQTLPSQLKQQFIQQNSKNFCSKLPFFYMLETQTKKRICQTLKIQVMSPHQYLTHKKLGLKKIIILRKGIVGLAYKKKGSSLHGRIVDTIQIASQKEKPELLNIYLLIRGKKLLYDIICQNYCIVALLQFESFVQSLKQSEIDFESYHQTYDEAIFRTNDWFRKSCYFCHSKHSIFACPKMHYSPLKSILFMKNQRRPGKSQRRAEFRFHRQKIWYSKCSPLKIWRKLFVPFEKVFDTNIIKSQTLRISQIHLKEQKQKENQTSKLREFQHIILTKQFYDTISLNVDLIQNFRYYFHKDNANNLIERSVYKDKNKSSFQIQRIEQGEVLQVSHYQ